MEKPGHGHFGKFPYNQSEVEGDELEIRTPAWNKFVKRSTVKAPGDLGVQSNIRSLVFVRLELQKNLSSKKKAKIFFPGGEAIKNQMFIEKEELWEGGT